MMRSRAGKEAARGAPKSRAGSAATSISTPRDGRPAICARRFRATRRAGARSRSRSSSVKNGSGPTILFTGGVHGDEYEGQIAISRLARTLDPATVQGAGDHDSGAQHAGGDERHAPLAGRQSRHEPLLSGKPARHVLRDAGAFHRRARAAACRRLGRPAHLRPLRRMRRSRPTCTTSPTRRCARRPWRRRRPSARPSTSCSGASTKARR